MTTASVSTYYHGTSRAFRPGELVLPPMTTGADPGFQSRDDVVYLTTDLAMARKFAGESARVRGGTPRVYEVAPSADVEEGYWASFSEWVASSARVVREVPPGRTASAAPSEDETEAIRERRSTAEAREPHDFQAAEWTHPHGHPRCRLCGAEERVGGRCEGADHDGLETSSPGSKGVTAAVDLDVRDTLVAYHGTTGQALPAILRKGLNDQSRGRVYFSAAPGYAKIRGEGMARKIHDSHSVLLTVHVPRSVVSPEEQAKHGRGANFSIVGGLGPERIIDVEVKELHYAPRRAAVDFDAEDDYPPELVTGPQIEAALDQLEGLPEHLPAGVSQLGRFAAEADPSASPAPVGSPDFWERVPVVRLPLDGTRWGASQHHLTRSHLVRAVVNPNGSDYEPGAFTYPLCALVGGVVWVRDGHHRTVADMLLGKRHVFVRLYDQDRYGPELSRPGKTPMDWAADESRPMWAEAAAGAWWHAGGDPRRASRLEYVHLGTRAAATSRRVGPYAHRALYRVQVRPSRPLNTPQTPLEDWEANVLGEWMAHSRASGEEPPVSYEALRSPGDARRVVARTGWTPGHDAVYYSNFVEDSGSVSLMVLPSAVRSSEMVVGDQLPLWVEASKVPPLADVYLLQNYDVRPYAKKLTMDGCAALFRRILLDARFPEAENAYAVPHPTSGKSSVAWDPLLDTPLIALDRRMCDEMTVCHEAAHVLRNGPALIGRRNDGAIPDGGHDQQWWDTYLQVLRRYGTPAVVKAFESAFSIRPERTSYRLVDLGKESVNAP